MNSLEIKDMKEALGEPMRYAYKAQPMLLYKKTDSGFMKSEFITVTFEQACDLLDHSWIELGFGTSDPYVVSKPEPGINPDTQTGIILHDVLLTYETFVKLQQRTNSRGNLRRYNGVVEAYDLAKIADYFGEKTDRYGLWLDDEAFLYDCVRYPTIPFDEKRHTRFVQASFSYDVKNKKKLHNCRKT